eukprot:5315891-Pyramimonas_sp.AAC.1
MGDHRGGRVAGITNIPAKEWLSAETAAQPFASQSMGPQEARFGRTDRRGHSEHDDIMSAFDSRRASDILP